MLLVYGQQGIVFMFIGRPTLVFIWENCASLIFLTLQKEAETEI